MIRLTFRSLEGSDIRHCYRLRGRDDHRILTATLLRTHDAHLSSQPCATVRDGLLNSALVTFRDSLLTVRVHRKREMFFGTKAFILFLIFVFISTSIVTSQVQHLQGWLDPVVVQVLRNVHSYFHVTNPTNQWTVCAEDPPNVVVGTIGHHGACLQKCLRGTACVAYNFHWDTTRCELYNFVPWYYAYDGTCVHYRVSIRILAIGYLAYSCFCCYCLDATLK